MADLTITEVLDLASGDWVTQIGRSVSATELKIAIDVTGILLP